MKGVFIFLALATGIVGVGLLAAIVVRFVKWMFKVKKGPE